MALSSRRGGARRARTTLGWAACMALACMARGGAHVAAQAPAESSSAGVSVTGGANVVGQRATEAGVRSEVVSSLDLFLEAPLRSLRFVVYVEANTTPFRDGVSRRVGEANTDAGTALNRRRRGRVQLSEVRAVVPLGAADLHLGLLDATGFIDVSRIANDENLFFLGVPFVNNPTIEFPDYALGVAVQGGLPDRPGIRFAGVVTSSHGLADNPGVSYAQLLDLREQGKGAFLGATLRWKGDSHRVSLGSWLNTAEHPSLSGDGHTETNRGVFAVLGWFHGPHSLSARLGLANQEVSVVRAFAGLTYLGTHGSNALGLAIARSEPSSLDPDLAPVTHGEAFLRRALWRDVYATFSVQRIVNSGFARPALAPSGGVWVQGIRLSVQF